MVDKPLDLLRQSLGKNVLLKLRGKKELKGLLLSYDQHLNLYLDNAELISEDEDTPPEKLGKIVLRGDNVILISPP